MKKLCEALIGGVLLGVLVMAPALLVIWDERAAPAYRSSPNSCRQLDSVERKCAYGSCDRWMNRGSDSKAGTTEPQVNA